MAYKVDKDGKAEANTTEDAVDTSNEARKENTFVGVPGKGGVIVLDVTGLTDEQIASVAEEHLTGTVIQERIDNAQVTRSEKLDGIDAGAFYNSYNEKIEALTAADEAANGADSAGQEPADGAQGTDGAQEPADGGTEPTAE